MSVSCHLGKSYPLSNDVEFSYREGGIASGLQLTEDSSITNQAGDKVGDKIIGD
jgi:hypothetical protein